MRIAVFADIHGNLLAFEAALAHARLQGIDHLVIAGDLINGAPDSLACWQLAQSLNCTILRGNHERYIFDFGTPNAPDVWATERFAPVRWCVAQFSAADRQALAALPFSLSLPTAPELLFVHASLRRDNDSITPYTALADLAAMFPTVDARWIVRGHNHLCQIQFWREHTIVTTGSIGWTLDEHPLAQYVLLERDQQGWRAQHQAVPYDVGATVARFHSTGYYHQAGPMVRLILREIATASPQIIPFLRHYEHWAKFEALSLAAAIERFLLLY